MKPYKYTKEVLQEAVDNSSNWMEVLAYLGLRKAGGTHSHIKKVADAFGINHGHFLGARSNLGRTFTKKDISFYLVNHGPYISSHALKIRLIKQGLKEHRCENCGSTEWLGEPIPIELDHKNGDRFDNRLENLRILCPNCHAQTGTYCKIKRA